MKDFFKSKIDQNAAPQSDIEGNRKIPPLVSSVAIAYVLSLRAVDLDREDFAKLFLSFILEGEPTDKTCNSYQELLRYFPAADSEWQ